jgi:hypothetical protein
MLCLISGIILGQVVMKKVQGEFYSGFSRDEAPRYALFEDRKIEVIEIVRRKRILDSKTGKIQDAFICRLADGSTVLIESPLS